MRGGIAAAAIDADLAGGIRAGRVDGARCTRLLHSRSDCNIALALGGVLSLWLSSENADHWNACSATLATALRSIAAAGMLINGVCSYLVRGHAIVTVSP